jgi:hypothetical protein
VDLPDRFRDVLSHLLEEVVSLREQAKRVRGAGRDDLTARLPGLDAQLTAAAREAVTPDDLAAIEAEATGDLAPFRLRLADDVWRHSLDVTVDRLLRERLGLPTLELP